MCQQLLERRNLLFRKCPFAPELLLKGVRERFVVIDSAATLGGGVPVGDGGRALEKLFANLGYVGAVA